MFRIMAPSGRRQDWGVEPHVSVLINPHPFACGSLIRAGQPCTSSVFFPPKQNVEHLPGGEAAFDGWRGGDAAVAMGAVAKGY